MLSVDFDLLGVLVEDLGDREEVADLVQTYLDLLVPRLGQLTTGDEAARRTAHTLKSGAQLLGASELAAAAAAIEAGGGSISAVRLAAAEASIAWRAWLESA